MKNLQVNVELGLVAALIPLVWPILSIQDVSVICWHASSSAAMYVAGLVQLFVCMYASTMCRERERESDVIS